MTTALADPRAAARFMNAYARRYSAGAFATPTASEISKLRAGDPGTRGSFREWPGVMAAVRQLSRDSYRKDFTGREYKLPSGSTVVTHLAADPDAALPGLDWADAVYAYIEDHNVTHQLRAQGREAMAVRVSASSELIGCWGRAGSGFGYPPEDAATLVQLPLTVTADHRAAILREVAGLSGWHDDFPFYSDGSWSALSLRGFNPADPQWGIKPAEMSKAWWAENPQAAQYTRCDWTVLADRCPSITALVKRVGWWGELERVRLLQMAGRGGKGGTLSRHSDVTDRAAGTRNGAIARFHIPLVTHPDITMSGWNLHGRTAAVHLPPWTMWYLDARKPHAVHNRSGVDRVHLVVDVVADSEVRTAIAGGSEWVP